MGIAGPGWRNYNGLTLWLDPANYMSRCLLGTGEYQPEVSSAIMDFLPVGGTFVDVGANVGYMSMLAASKAGANARVYAVEPCPSLADAIDRHLRKNQFSNVIVIRAGCSNAAGVLPLFIAPEGNLGKTSLSAENAQSSDAVSVEVVPLDDLLAAQNPTRIDVIKIDVEGAELQVLQGARETLRRFLPTIIMELDGRLLKSFGTSPQDILEFLERAGYRHEFIGEYDIVARPLA